MSVKDQWSSVKKAGDLESLAKLKMLVYGPSGSGKSRLGALFRRPLIGLTEHQAIPTIQEANPDAMIKLIRNAQELKEFRDLIRSPELPERVDAVVLDSLTDAQRIIRQAYTDAQKSGRTTTDMDTWGLIIDATARLAREVRDLQTHVLVITLDEEREDGEIVTHRPSVNGKKLPNDLAQYFNLVGYVHKREYERGLRYEVMFAGSDRYLVKGMSALNPVEAPEPQHWIAKRFGHEADDDVQQRVAEWERQATARDSKSEEE